MSLFSFPEAIGPEIGAACVTVWRTIAPVRASEICQPPRLPLVETPAKISYYQCFIGRLYVGLERSVEWPRLSTTLCAGTQEEDRDALGLPRIARAVRARRARIVGLETVKMQNNL
jgi:hypothetical protein